MLKTDILVVGTGIAGLSFAIKAATRRKDLSITIMTKNKAEVSNTQFAQGGIAAVLDTIEDSFEQHIEDTLKAGRGYCDKKIVQMVISQAPDRLHELIGLGVHFDTNGTAGYDLALEGGHTHRRILHHGDATGMELERALLATAKSISNINILENHTVIDLAVEKTICTGAFFMCRNKVEYIRFKAIVLSTGGCGQLFKYTTNPGIATADGVAMANRAGALIADMQYMQFHPTALYEPGKNPLFLLTEALRGGGAHIINEEGKRFLFQSDPRGELATRDIISRSIFKELKKSGKEFVYLDCRHMDPKSFRVRFPSILSYCRSIHLDPFTQLLPITPVAHYQCGGVVVNEHAQSSIHNLYAIGECARTGLHGKNRLASNSLLEAVVFAHQAAENICEAIDHIAFSTKVYINKYGTAPVKINLKQVTLIKKQLQEVLHSFYLEEDTTFSLATEAILQLKKQALTLYDNLEIYPELIEVINMLTVAALMVKHKKNDFLITT